MSNKTLKASAAKTASARSRAPRLFVLGLLVIFFVSCALGYYRRETPGNLQNITGQYCLILPDEKKCSITLEPAITPAQHTQGLSGREGLLPNKGMIFIFDRPDGRCFWMKDMKFAIDIIFLDESKKVVRVDANVQPNSYPQNFCADNTKYVIELPPNTAGQNGITTGRQLRF